MSRLDDELRQAFRREEPSPDFTTRVMKAVAAAPAPKRRWWEDLLARLTTPRGRWVAVGATVSLLALILTAQYNRLEQAAPKGPETAQEVSEPAHPATRDRGKSEPVANDKQKERVPEYRRPRHHHRDSSAGRVAATKPEAVKSEGEIARDQLMRALHIASASLNEAQRMVSVSEGHQPRTVAR
jgi:hypothetical protein